MKNSFVIIFYVLLLSLVFTACKHKKKVIKTNDSTTKNETKTTPSKSSVVEEKLGMTKKEISKSSLYSFVAEWYGTPYKYGGCEKTGVDCSCFTNILYNKIYNKKIGRSTAEIYKEVEKIKVEKIQEGDLIFFITNGKSISHVGVYLKDNKFVHASNSKGVMINDLSEAYYKKTFHSVTRYKN